MKNRTHAAFFLRHDLMHYAVESVLGFREAFYGLLAAGRSIDSFNRPGSGKCLPDEAVFTEFIVAAVDRRLLFGEPVEAAAINAELIASLNANAGPAPPLLSQASLDEIVNTFRSTFTRFHSLDVGEHIEMPFPRRAVMASG